MTSEPVKSPQVISSRAGFTMIELMVVVAIIVMASGVMGPTIIDFMKNRELEGIRGQFGKIFNKARLDAVIQRRDISVVFFREGPRIYDELRKSFEDGDIWSSKGPALGEDPPEIWYGLGFAGGSSSYDKDQAELVAKARNDSRQTIPRSIPSFSQWAESPRSIYRGGRTNSRSGSSGADPGEESRKYRTNDLFKVTFNRNGTMVFSDGCSDVATSVFNNEGATGCPKTADVVIFQFDSQMACFMDVRPTGQVRSKVRPLGAIPDSRGDVRSIRVVKK
jgi:prepilin-type N-terminal cleavage/methylation domain-containing protein